MKTLSVLSFVWVLTGCATSGTQMQAGCEARFRQFQEIYWCTHDAVVARNPGILSDPRAKLYLLKGEQLAQQVDSGKISSLDAKVEWQGLYVQLKSAKDQEIMAMTALTLRSIEASRPVSPPVATVPSAALRAPQQVNCTSTVGARTISTSCQ